MRRILAFAASPTLSGLGAALVAAVLVAPCPSAAAFPPGFSWGTAIAGFQSEMGADPASIDTGSDWWAWVHDPANIAAHRVSGDLPENGPGFFDLYFRQVKQARRGLGSTTLRLSVEWSRIFPTSTAAVDASGGITLAVLQQLDALADHDALERYRAILAEIRTRKMRSFVTLSHFALPLWIHDPIAARDALAGRDPSGPLPTGFAGGWLDASTVVEFEKYAAYLAWQLGDLVDLWAPLNEPMVVAVSGYVNVPGALAGNFPPGAFSFTGAIQAVLHEVDAHARAYDAVHAWDLADADGDGDPAEVGFVHNMVAFAPKNPLLPVDVTGAAHADQIFNRLWPDAIVDGDVDANANGVADPGEYRPDVAGKADFFGVNYYLRATAAGTGFPLTPVIPILDFLPTLSYATPQNPTAPACPSTCTEFGWEIYPTGLREVLTTAGTYGLPVLITENGLADSDDDQRPSYLVRHLAAIEQVVADGLADVRGYYQWSLMDNFEWSSGYYPRFGLYEFDQAGRLTRRRSAAIFARIARRNDIPARLRAKYLP